MDFTTVIGIDRHKFESFKLTFPTWARNKPSFLLKYPVLIFLDGVTPGEVSAVINGACKWVEYRTWPPIGVTYDREHADKWSRPQRAKMLAGFCHIPAWWVKTPYWFKIDVDAIAHRDDDWVDDLWFSGMPAIIAPSWGYSKPADIILRLDRWAADHPKIPMLQSTQPLGLGPNLGSDLVRHQRIASWCAFFNTQFTIECSAAAEATCGTGQIPVDSQDTYHWYMAHRAGMPIRTVRVQKHGWQVCGSHARIQQVIQEMECRLPQSS